LFKKRGLSKELMVLAARSIENI